MSDTAAELLRILFIAKKVGFVICFLVGKKWNKTKKELNIFQKSKAENCWNYQLETSVKRLIILGLLVFDDSRQTGTSIRVVNSKTEKRNK